MSSSDSASDRIVLAFQERYWADRAEGKTLPLAHYLGCWSGADAVIAREFLLLEGKATSVADGAAPRRAGCDDLERVGPYELQELIGRGGQGQVYRAFDTRLHRVVALKILTGLGPGAETQIKRFRREAEVASRLDHPGICAVHDAGIDQGVPYIAMRFVEGKTLGQRIALARTSGLTDTDTCFFAVDDAQTTEPSAAAKPTSDSAAFGIGDSSMSGAQVRSIIEVFERAALALHAAHEAGVVHRDIKPGNIMVATTGDPVILDFGLAYDQESDDFSLTKTGDLFGTPAYMSPEQIAGMRVRIDRRSDVYSLGVSLYECLTLKPAFDAPTREGLYQAILTKEAVDPRTLNAAIPKDLWVVIETAIAKDRDKRYQTAESFAADLRAVRLSEPISARPIGVFGRALRWSKRRPALAALYAALAIGIPVIAALGGVLIANLPEIEAQRQAQRTAAVESHLESGFFELNHGVVDVALGQFDAALAIDPSAAEALAGRMLVAIKKRRFEDAIQWVRAAKASLEPTAAAGLEAAVLRESGRTAEADRVLAAAPPARSAIAHFVLAGLEMTRAHGLPNEFERPQAFRRAADELRRAALASPRPRRVYHFELAHACGHIGKDLKPEEAVNAIEALWPESYLGRLICGRALSLCEPERALSLLRRAQEMEPGRNFVRLDIGLTLARSGRTGEAETEFKSFPETDHLYPAALNNLAICRREAGDSEGAHAIYERIHERDPDDIAGLLGLGNGLRALGRVDESIELFRRALALAPDSTFARSNLGLSYIDAGKPEDAIRCFEAIEEKLKDDAYFWLNFAAARTVAGQHEEARRYLARGIAVDPKNMQCRLTLGAIHFEAGEIETALEIYEEALVVDPESADGHMAIAQVYRKAGDFGSSLSHICKGHIIGKKLRMPWTPASAELLRTEARKQARRLADAKDIEKARAAVREALIALPDDPTLLDLMDDL